MNYPKFAEFVITSFLIIIFVSIIIKSICDIINIIKKRKK